MDRYIVTKSEIDKMSGVDKHHYLNPNAKRNQKSLSELVGLEELGVSIIEVAPFCDSTELHVHAFEEECIYILDGQGTATIGEQVTQVSSGDFIGYRTNGKAHKLTNTSDKPMKIMVVGQRSKHDVCDYPVLKKRLFRNKGMAWNLVDIESIDSLNRP